MKFLVGFLQYKWWENTREDIAVQLFFLNAATHTELYIKVLTIIQRKEDMITIIQPRLSYSWWNVVFCFSKQYHSHEPCTLSNWKSYQHSSPSLWIQHINGKRKTPVFIKSITSISRIIYTSSYFSSGNKQFIITAAYSTLLESVTLAKN